VSQLADPEVTSPFLDWSSPKTREDMKFGERNSWFLMKFPTRLPHLDHGSLVGGATKQTVHHHTAGVSSAVKSEVNEEGLEVVSSNNEVMDTANPTSATGDVGAIIGGNGPAGYDNTLKDIAPGRYGKIVVYKSGRTELVVGGHSGGPEVRNVLISYKKTILNSYHTSLDAHIYYYLGPDANQRRVTMWLPTRGSFNRCSRREFCTNGRCDKVLDCYTGCGESVHFLMSLSISDDEYETYVPKSHLCMYLIVRNNVSTT
jgi:hypothetical protein